MRWEQVFIVLGLLYFVGRKTERQADADKAMADLERSFGVEPDPIGGSVAIGCVQNVETGRLACPEGVFPE